MSGQLAAVRTEDIPNDVMYHFADKRQSYEQLINTIYSNPNSSTRAHFKSVNAHLGTEVRPGQLAIITPPSAGYCSAYERDLGMVARHIDHNLPVQSDENAKVAAQHYDTLSNSVNSCSSLG